MARRFRFWQILFVLGLGMSILLGQVSGLKAQTSSRDLVQQGVTEYQQGQYRAAIKNWNHALTIKQSGKNRLHKVIILENIARAYQKLGQTEKEIGLWQDVTELYQQLGESKQLGRSLTELAQAYSSLGQHRKAIAILCGNEDDSECTSNSAIAIARKTTDSLGEIAAKGSLGEAYRLRGDYTVAVSYLKDSFKIARTFNLPLLEMSALNSLGNTYSSLAQVSYRQAESAETKEEIAFDDSVIKFRENGKERDRMALDYFQQSFDLATKQENSLAEVRSLIDSIPIYYRLADFNAAANSKQQAINLIPTLPLESTAVYATIDLAKLLQSEKVSFSNCYEPKTIDRARSLLQQAVELARQLGDNRVTSFALGELGHTYECSKDYQQALEITKQARFAAEGDKDSLYLWEWQTGRILSAEGKQDSIAAYETAIATLESIRDNILTANRDVQFDFRDTVEPIYRELIERRLGSIDNISVIEPSQTKQVRNVNSILTTLDSLRLAELQNYFGNDCAINDSATIDGINLLNPDSHTAYISTVILENGTAVIANFPEGKSKIVWNSNKGKKAIAEEINQYRTRLQKHYVNATFLGQDIYSWLIKPFAEDLQREQITTLVFVHDGLLRSIPMSALHDGEQFLIQKYAIATTPSLNLVSPTTLERQKLRVLALGLSKASLVDDRSFSPLPNVETEITLLKSIFEESTGLLNDDFSRDRLQQELAANTYPIVHIATHGEFSSEPENTFLITGKNEKLTINQLDRIIRSTARNEPLSLISLTACETAVGDERAALGLAGVAIQAGASSALASLWAISDGITPVAVEDFYLGLQDANQSKAVALQKAQIALIEQDVPPAFWSPFILIGNWR